MIELLILQYHTKNKILFTGISLTICLLIFYYIANASILSAIVRSKKSNINNGKLFITTFRGT